MSEYIRISLIWAMQRKESQRIQQNQSLLIKLKGYGLRVKGLLKKVKGQYINSGIQFIQGL